jgi:hypothetical protein
VSSYHIKLRTAGRVWETVAVESSDLTALRTEVAEFVGELLKDHAQEVWKDEDWRVDVTDENGLILYVMHILATDTAATALLAR